MSELMVRFILHLPASDIADPIRLMFNIEEAHWFYLDFCRTYDSKLPNLSLNDFAGHLFRRFPKLAQHSGRESEMTKEFKAYKHTVVS